MNTLNQLSVLSVCYVVLFLLCFTTWRMKSASLISLKVQTGNWILLHIRHAGGMIIMTLVPLMFLPEFPLDLLDWPENIEIIKIITLIVTGSSLAMLSAKEAQKKEAENLGLRFWSSSQIVLHLALRSIFLAAYEWFFRGILLFSCISVFGFLPAIIINIVLYSLIHSFKGRKELIGSVPLGIVLCGFTIWWQSVWPAILLHLILSSTYESIILNHLFNKRSKFIL